LAVVDKKREIYFIQNAKFHIDRVKKLGNFVEIEVFGPAQAGKRLKAECDLFQKLLGIRAKDLVRDSYSDQLLRQQTTNPTLRTKNKKSEKRRSFC
jgi:predicted adenylyl cyclase CyaB